MPKSEKSQFGVYGSLNDIPDFREHSGEMWRIWRIFTNDEVFFDQKTGKQKSHRAITSWMTRMRNAARADGFKLLFVRCKAGERLYEVLYRTLI